MHFPFNQAIGDCSNGGHFMLSDFSNLKFCYLKFCLTLIVSGEINSIAGELHQ